MAGKPTKLTPSALAVLERTPGDAKAKHRALRDAGHAVGLSTVYAHLAKHPELRRAASANGTPREAPGTPLEGLPSAIEGDDVARLAAMRAWLWEALPEWRDRLKYDRFAAPVFASYSRAYGELARAIDALTPRPDADRDLLGQWGAARRAELLAAAEQAAPVDDRDAEIARLRTELAKALAS